MGRLHSVSRFWARMIAGTLPLWKIRVEGMEKIQKGKAYVIVSNHQSMLDILLLLASLPLHFKFIAKRELFWIPFFGWHLYLARYICLRRGDAVSGRAALESARQWIRRGVSVLFFPEGTRSLDGVIHEFKAGAFKVALEERVEILPLVITGTHEAFPKHSWWVERPVLLRLEVLDPVPPEKMTISELNFLRERIRTQIINEFNRFRGEAHV